MENDMTRSARNYVTKSPRINVRANQCVVSANVIKASPERDRVGLELSNRLDHAVTIQMYDAILCGTGYDRSFWMKIIANSNLASRYGLVNSSDDMKTIFYLAPEHQRNAETVQSSSFNGSVLFSQPASATNSSIGTPLSSHNSFELSSIRIPVYISRRYLLSPIVSASDLKHIPRIYLQGYSEATHGLSDTLLSVIGVRAGEIVEDLWQNSGN